MVSPELRGRCQGGHRVRLWGISAFGWKWLLVSCLMAAYFVFRASESVKLTMSAPWPAAWYGVCSILEGGGGVLVFIGFGCYCVEIDQAHTKRSGAGGVWVGAGALAEFVGVGLRVVLWVVGV